MNLRPAGHSGSAMNTLVAPLAGLALVLFIGFYLNTHSADETTGALPAAAAQPDPALPAGNEGKPAKPPQPTVMDGLPEYLSGRITSLAEVNVPDARLELMLSGLRYPWAAEFISDTELLITEISGKLSRFDIESRKLTPITGVPHTSAGLEQSGLLDVALHPDFAVNHRIYFSYTISDEKNPKFMVTAVGTGILEGDQLTGVERILSAEPFTWSPSNFGGALEFDDQGYLYVAIGDRSEHGFAQLGDRPQGKILRVRDDGSIPLDNPFVGDQDIDDRIWALGVRNPQGLYFDPQSRRLFETEHGPQGGDEVNIILRGANYGWPEISYGMNYPDIGLGDVGQAGTHAEGMEQPLWYYLPSRAISPITMYRGDMFAEWDGDLLVGTLRGHSVDKLDLDGDRIRSEYPLLTEIDDRIRDIKVAADGSIFVLAQKGNLYRLYRPPPQPVVEINKGKYIYEVICTSCHEAGADGAPTLADRRGWPAIEQQPLELTYEHAINGYGLMPARGLCTICSDDHMRWAVDYMLEQAKLIDAEPAASDPP